MKVNLFCVLSTLIFFQNTYALPHRGQDDVTHDSMFNITHHNSSELNWKWDDNHINKTHRNHSRLGWDDNHINKTQRNHSRLRWEDNRINKSGKSHKEFDRSKIKNGPLSVRLK